MSTNIKLLWGPGAGVFENIGGFAFSGHALNDNDRRIATVGVCLPKDGTVTDIGFLISTKNGTPPAYSVGIVTIDSAGAPTTTGYGGSAVKAYTPTSTGWKWVTLDTAATAAAGDLVALMVYPGVTAPDASNNISAVVDSIGEGFGHSRIKQYGYWYEGTTAPPMAIRYSDGSVYGYAIATTSPWYIIRSNTTPDEVGCKFTLPLEMSVVGLKFYVDKVHWGGSATFDVVIYDADNNIMRSLSVADKDHVSGVTQVNLSFDPVTLSANTVYRAVIKATTATAGDMYVNTYFLESAAARSFFPCGAEWQLTTRTDAGAWTDTATAIVPMALYAESITLPAGGATAMEYAYIG